MSLNTRLTRMDWCYVQMPINIPAKNLVPKFIPVSTSPYHGILPRAKKLVHGMLLCW